MPKYCNTCKLQGHNEKECFIFHPKLYSVEEDEEEKKSNKREKKKKRSKKRYKKSTIKRKITNKRIKKKGKRTFKNKGERMGIEGAGNFIEAKWNKNETL